MLKVNCDKNTKLYNSLKRLNKENCIKNGKTQRETINNKTVCYDNIAKEIVTKFDMESNCLLSKKINKKIDKIPLMNNNLKPKTNKDTKSTINEGPEFINKWDLPSYDKQNDKFSSL